MRISELAARVGVPTSTVRYYERTGLLRPPARTASGYRDYDEDAATRLLFVHRARRLGLSCDVITELLPVWDGVNCSAAHGRVSRLLEDKKSEVKARIAELRSFAAQIDEVQALLDASVPPETCRSDLTCCVPESTGGFVPIELVTGRSH